MHYSRNAQRSYDKGINVITFNRGDLSTWNTTYAYPDVICPRRTRNFCGLAWL